MSNQQSLGLSNRGREQPPTPFSQSPAPLAQAAAQHETAISASVAHVEAMTKAKFVVALSRPRDWERVTDRLMAACRRPGFAERAIYKKPRGGDKFDEGLSIRFAEEAARAMGNLDTKTLTTYDDINMRKLWVTVMDLESNLTDSREVVIEKTVERRSKKGREVLGERENSYGKKVYIVRATDDELLAKQNALTSKAVRNLQLTFLPADIAEACLEACYESIRKRDSKGSREDIIARMLDAFEKLGVSEGDILRYLRSPDVNQLSTEQINDLRKIHESLRDGEATWQDYVDAIDRD